VLDLLNVDCLARGEESQVLILDTKGHPAV
jgi:hypothetical protein